MHDDKAKADKAGKVVLNFGIHKDKTIAQVAETDNGLCYLDAVVDTADFMVQQDIKDYLEYRPIANELRQITE